MVGRVLRRTSDLEQIRPRVNNPTVRRPLASRSDRGCRSNPSHPGRVLRILPKHLGLVRPSSPRLLAPVLPPTRTALAVRVRAATTRIAPVSARIVRVDKGKEGDRALARTASVAARVDTPVRGAAQAPPNDPLAPRNRSSTSMPPSSSFARPSWSASWLRNWEGSLFRSSPT